MTDHIGLIEAILQEGLQKEKEILSQADEGAKELIRQVGEESVRQEAAAMEALDKEMALHRIRERHRLRLEFRRQVAKLQDQIVRELFQWVRNRLGRLRGEDAYSEGLKRIWKEALEGLDFKEIPEGEVRVHPEDQSAIEKWIAARLDDTSWRIVPDPAISGGVELLLDQGRVRISNTLESRLDRGWQLWLPELRQRLFGSRGS